MNIPYEEKTEKVKLNMDKIVQDMGKFPVPEPRITSIDLQNSYQLNMNGFLNKFKDIDSLNDQELYDFIRNSYLTVLDASNQIKVRSGEDLTINESYMALMRLFTNNRFLCILNNIIAAVRLDDIRKVYLNHIIYNYITLPEFHKDQVIERLMLDLSITSNADLIPILLGIGLPNDLATLIALAKYSSTNEYVCIRRVNFYIFNSGNMKLMTLQRIVDIFQFCFNECVTKLFEGTMFDVYSTEDLSNATEDQREIYRLTGIAVLELLNSMPSSAITTILNSYHADYLLKMQCPVRFSMRLSDDYYRINEVIDMLQREGIYLP